MCSWEAGALIQEEERCAAGLGSLRGGRLEGHCWWSQAAGSLCLWAHVSARLLLGAWLSAIHTGNPDGAPGGWHQPGPVPVIAGNQEVNQ